MSKVKGVKQAIDKTKSELDGLKKRTMAGLLAGALIIERQAKKDVPRERGDLVGSGYSGKHPEKPMTARVGFTVGYALWVHENKEQVLKGKPRKSGLGVYWGPAGKPRYLAGAAEAKRAEVMAAIAKYARKK